MESSFRNKPTNVLNKGEISFFCSPTSHSVSPYQKESQFTRKHGSESPQASFFFRLSWVQNRADKLLDYWPLAGQHCAFSRRQTTGEWRQVRGFLPFMVLVAIWAKPGLIRRDGRHLTSRNVSKFIRNSNCRQSRGETRKQSCSLTCFLMALTLPVSHKDCVCPPTTQKGC